MTLLSDLLAAQDVSLTGNAGVPPSSSLLVAEPPSDILYDFSFLDDLVSPTPSTDWFSVSVGVSPVGYDGLLSAGHSPWAGFHQAELDLQAALQAYRTPYGVAGTGLVMDEALFSVTSPVLDDATPTLWAAPTQQASTATNMGTLHDGLFQSSSQPAPQAVLLNQILDVQDVSSVVAEMSRYAAPQSMTLATVEDVSYTPALMQLIAGDW